MKKISVLVLFFICVQFAVNAQTQSPTPTDSVVINAKGFAVAKIKTSAVCDMCKETIEKAMAYEKGVKESNLDVESKMLTVTFDPKKTTLANIRKAVTLTGYDADGILADEKAYNNLNPCCKKDAHQ